MKFFTLNLECDSFGFDFVMIHMLWLVNNFIEFGCYDMLCHVIFYEQECNFVRFQLKKNDSVFIKTMCSFKSVQVRPNHGMIMIYAKPSRWICLIGLPGVILRTPPKFICIINGRIPMIHRKN
jgi:hypothetical protein